MGGRERGEGGREGRERGEGEREGGGGRGGGREGEEGERESSPHQLHCSIMVACVVNFTQTPHVSDHVW